MGMAIWYVMSRNERGTMIGTIGWPLWFKLMIQRPTGRHVTSFPPPLFTNPSSLFLSRRSPESTPLSVAKMNRAMELRSTRRPTCFTSADQVSSSSSMRQNPRIHGRPSARCPLTFQQQLVVSFALLHWTRRTDMVRNISSAVFVVMARPYRALFVCIYSEAPPFNPTHIK